MISTTKNKNEMKPNLSHTYLCVCEISLLKKQQQNDKQKMFIQQFVIFVCILKVEKFLYHFYIVLYFFFIEYSILLPLFFILFFENLSFNLSRMVKLSHHHCHYMTCTISTSKLNFLAHKTQNNLKR